MRKPRAFASVVLFPQTGMDAIVFRLRGRRRVRSGRRARRQPNVSRSKRRANWRPTVSPKGAVRRPAPSAGRNCDVVAGKNLAATQGGVFRKRNGRSLEGRTWDEMPAVWAARAAGFVGNG